MEWSGLQRLIITKWGYYVSLTLKMDSHVVVAWHRSMAFRCVELEALNVEMKIASIVITRFQYPLTTYP
jgi:predicted DNA-binding transcriptional regulator YafY